MFQFGEFRLDVRERRFTRGSSEVPLPPKAFDLLALFVAHSGELLTKEVLLRELWPQTFVEEGVLSVYVSALRKALGDTAGTSKYAGKCAGKTEAGPRAQTGDCLPTLRPATGPLPTSNLIETVPKKGYRFVGTVIEMKAAEPPRPRVRFLTVTIGSITLLAVLFAGEIWQHGGNRELTQYALEKAWPLTSSPGIVYQPAVSADGKRVAYVWEPFDGGPMRIYVQTVAGSDRTPVTTGPGYSVAPAWSPNGQQIAFLFGTRDGGPVDVMLADLRNPNSPRKLVSLCISKHERPTGRRK